MPPIFYLLVIPLGIIGALYLAYYATVSEWTIDPARHYGSIKKILEGYGNLTDSDKNAIESQRITQSLAEKAVNLALPSYLK